MPEVLEGSKRRLTDVKLLAKDITGTGILVKLFPVGDSSRPLWIVGSPHTNKWAPTDANAKANDKAKVSHAVKTGPAPKLISGKAERQEEQRSRARGERKVANQQVQEGQGESEDVGDTQEEEEEDDAGEDDTGEDDAGGDDAGEDIEEDLNHSEAEVHLEEGKEEEGKEERAAVNDENEYDTKEQIDDGHNRASGEAEAEEADKRVDEEHKSEEDLADDLGEKEEQEAGGQQEAEREGEREGEEKTGDETEPHGDTRGKNCAFQGGLEEKHGGNEEAGEEQGDHDQFQRVENAMRASLDRSSLHRARRTTVRRSRNIYPSYKARVKQSCDPRLKACGCRMSTLISSAQTNPPRQRFLPLSRTGNTHVGIHPGSRVEVLQGPTTLGDIMAKVEL